MKANRILLSKINMKNKCECIFHVSRELGVQLLRECKYHERKTPIVNKHQTQVID